MKAVRPKDKDAVIEIIGETLDMAFAKVRPQLRIFNKHLNSLNKSLQVTKTSLKKSAHTISALLEDAVKTQGSVIEILSQIGRKNLVDIEYTIDNILPEDLNKLVTSIDEYFDNDIDGWFSTYNSTIDNNDLGFTAEYLKDKIEIFKKCCRRY